MTIRVDGRKAWIGKEARGMPKTNPFCLVDQNERVSEWSCDEKWRKMSCSTAKKLISWKIEARK
jgi:hypothetical protein